MSKFAIGEQVEDGANDHEIGRGYRGVSDR